MYRVQIEKATPKLPWFCRFGFERAFDIQEWVANEPSILGEDLLIIAKDCLFLVGQDSIFWQR